MKIIDFLLKKRAKVFVFDKKNQMPIELAGKLLNEVKAIFDANEKYRGRREHCKMWARIMSRQFVKQGTYIIFIFYYMNSNITISV